MGSIQLQASTSDIRIDKYIAGQILSLTRSQIQRLINTQHISVNNLYVKQSYIIKTGDNIEITIEEPRRLKAQQMVLKIIYEDSDVVVINKPAGLVVHPGPGHPDSTLVNALLYHCPELQRTDDFIRPGIIHRLDKDTSGLIVIVKNKYSKECLIDQFKNHMVTKKYYVLVTGHVSPATAIIDAPIGRNPDNYKKMTVLSSGKKATTYYSVKRYFNDCTLLDVTLSTGRTHQIRVHFSAINHPVVGDALYGKASSFVPRQFIHAHYLSFKLPFTNDNVRFNCPLTDDLVFVLKQLHNQADIAQR